MNFKALLEKYKQGTASDQEVRLIEAELAKFNAIEDYLSESLDHEISQQFVSDFDKRQQENKAVTKVVNRRLRRVVVTAVIAAALLYGVIFYGLSQIMEWSYYNPSSTSLFHDSEAYPQPNIQYDLEAWINMHFPEASLVFAGSESEKFGRHKIYAIYRNEFTGQEHRFDMGLIRNRLTKSDDTLTKWNWESIWNGFDVIAFNHQAVPADGSHFSDHYSKQNKTTDYFLKQLNPLSYLSLSLTFPEDMSLEQVYDLIEANRRIKFHWIGVRTMPVAETENTTSIPLVGFTPDFSRSRISSGLDETKYPLFYISQAYWKRNTDQERAVNYLAQAAETHFKTRLKFLIDRSRFVGIMEYPDKVDFYKSSLDYVAQHGAHSYGVVVAGTVKDLRDFLEKQDILTSYINGVLPAEPSKSLYTNPYSPWVIE